jgi:hypothetical protein
MDISQYVTDEQKYRSKPVVNMADDMVKVTLCMPIRDWRRIKGVAKESNDSAHLCLFGCRPGKHGPYSCESQKPPITIPNSPIARALGLIPSSDDRLADNDGWTEFEIEHMHLASGDWRKDAQCHRVRIRRPKLEQPRPDLKRVPGKVVDGRIVYHDINGRLIEENDRLNVYCKSDGSSKLGIAVESTVIVPGLVVRVHANPGFEMWRMDAYPVEIREREKE